MDDKHQTVGGTCVPLPYIRLLYIGAGVYIPLLAPSQRRSAGGNLLQSTFPLFLSLSLRRSFFSRCPAVFRAPQTGVTVVIMRVGTILRSPDRVTTNCGGMDVRYKKKRNNNALARVLAPLPCRHVPLQGPIFVRPPPVDGRRLVFSRFLRPAGSPGAHLSASIFPGPSAGEIVARRYR